MCKSCATRCKNFFLVEQPRYTFAHKIYVMCAKTQTIPCKPPRGTVSFWAMLLASVNNCSFKTSMKTFKLSKWTQLTWPSGWHFARNMGVSDKEWSLTAFLTPAVKMSNWEIVASNEFWFAAGFFSRFYVCVLEMQRSFAVFRSKARDKVTVAFRADSMQQCLNTALTSEFSFSPKPKVVREMFLPPHKNESCWEWFKTSRNGQGGGNIGHDTNSWSCVRFLGVDPPNSDSLQSILFCLRVDPLDWDLDIFGFFSQNRAFSSIFRGLLYRDAWP